MALNLTKHFWLELTDELHRRTEGHHESGAFILGTRNGVDRTGTTAVYYDELDPAAYDTGICILHADAFTRLWQRCSTLGLTCVADVHVHPFGAGQSPSDRTNPMIARAGHVAIILPRMARAPVRRWAVGVYEYLGDHRWAARGGCGGSLLKIGR